MKRVILTGGTGFVGANLARHLLYLGHELHLLVRPKYSSWRIDAIREHIHLHEIDLGDPDTVAALVGQIQPDWVFHLAAHGAYSSQTNFSQMVQTNILGTVNLVEACLKTGFESFVNTGSSSEYGLKDFAPTETSWLEPNSHYAVTKASATLFCRHAAQQNQVNIPTLRLYSVYGPYEEPTRLMPTLIVHGLRDELPPLVNPNIARDFVYTDDVNAAFVRAATQPNNADYGAVYNVGSGLQTTLSDVVTVARELMQISVEPNWGSMPDRQWDTSVWVANNHKIREELGWQPQYSFREGFRAMIDWLRADPQMLDLYRE